MKYERCPVCFNEQPLEDYDICRRCMFEAGVNDAGDWTLAQLREEYIDKTIAQVEQVLLKDFSEEIKRLQTQIKELEAQNEFIENCAWGRSELAGCE